jgi:hypothetical protein
VTRTISRPAISFEQWAAANGIKLPSDAIEAEVIGMAFIPHKTRRQKGRWRSKMSEYVDLVAARARYQAAIESGEVTTVIEEIPLDMTKASDQAYARVLAKRAARRK